MTHPQPAYHFRVDWGGANTGFSEISGLNIYIDVLSYRDGASPEYFQTHMPGMVHFSNIVLRRGIIRGDNDFFKWMNTQQMNTIERRDIVIALLDQSHSPIVIWKVKNAFPVRYSGPVLQANSSHIAMEELELAHDGISVEYE